MSKSKWSCLNKGNSIYVKACGRLSHSDFQGREIDHSAAALVGFIVSGGDLAGRPRSDCSPLDPSRSKMAFLSPT